MGQSKDEVGTLESKDTGTTSAPGIIGESRHFDQGKGINCGENIATFPTGSSSHTSEAWFRAEKPNATVLAWGNEERNGKVMLQFFSPPHMKIECYFSGADVEGSSTLATSQWIHVVHAYQEGRFTALREWGPRWCLDVHRVPAGYQESREDVCWRMVQQLPVCRRY